MSKARFVLLALAGASGVATAVAQDELTVYSARAESVSVTIYPNDLALITEARTVTLPDSAATLVIQDVVDTLLPQSVVVADLNRPLAENNFDFNQLTPASLLEHAVGTTVTLMRTNPVTGTVSYLSATVLSAGEDSEDIVLETEDGKEVLHCSGLPEGIVFDALPDGLYTEPRLSMKLAPGEGGERTFRVSYLAHGFTWSADYVAHLDESGSRMDLAGWATVTNGSGRAFNQAELQLVAGRLNVLSADLGGSLAAPDLARRDAEYREAMQRLTELNAPGSLPQRLDCFASPTPEDVLAEERLMRRVTGGASAMYGADYMIVTGNFISRETFGDYHLYRLPWRTDLGARQTKQVLFLDQRDAGIKRVYRLYVADIEGRLLTRLDEIGDPADRWSTAVAVPDLLLRSENTADAGLGEPLPSGSVKVFESNASGRIFVGQSSLEDRPVGAGIELEIARALNVLVEYRSRYEEGARTEIEADVLAVNDKGVPIDLEIWHRIDTNDYVDIEIEQSSQPFRRNGAIVIWDLDVPPGDASLTYTLSAREID